MKNLKRSWMVMLMGALLLSTLVGAAWARPQDRPQAQDITRKITIPAGFFSPANDGLDWTNWGNRIRVESGDGSFTAPVVFPCLPPVTVERFILYVNDKSAGGHACAELRRTRLPQGDEAVMASVCSPPEGTSTGVQPLIDSTISPNVVWPAHGVYAKIYFNAPNVEVHAVRIEYHRNI